MSGPSSYAALIPAFECAATVGTVVRGAREHLDRVLVVDDGSSDATALEARAAGAEVLSHHGNRGKGAALLSGLQLLREQGLTHAVSLDGDGEHSPTEIPKLFAESRAHPAALIVGSRQIESAVAAINRFGNRFANAWVKIATGRDLGDTQCGLRVYPIATMLGLHPTGLRFEFETEVLIRAVRAGIDVRSVAVRVCYPPPERRRSHYDKLWDTLRIIEMVVGLMLHRR
jgi:glycosyltransferase involved in cell wall biosynthesis